MAGAVKDRRHAQYLPRACARQHAAVAHVPAGVADQGVEARHVSSQASLPIAFPMASWTSGASVPIESGIHSSASMGSRQSDAGTWPVSGDVKTRHGDAHPHLPFEVQRSPSNMQRHRVAKFQPPSARAVLP